MEKYEYKIFSYNIKGFWGDTVDVSQLQTELNFLGNDGWELVSSLSTNQNQVHRKVLYVYLKGRRINLTIIDFEYKYYFSL